MKKISKYSLNVISSVMFMLFLLGVTQSVNAQDKPKGKPWAAPEAALKVKNPVKADDASIKEGKDLYSQHCKSCHGPKGKGDGPKAEKLDISCGDFSSDEFAKVSDAEAFWKTTEGRKPMPSFKEKLGTNERWSVINYVRSLGKGK